ncbi:MAG: hypothetical protein ACP5FZ_06675 [Fidelibacterota bacterium]
MKKIQRKIGIVCFCISMIFGVYTLEFQDYSGADSPSETTVARDCT